MKFGSLSAALALVGVAAALPNLQRRCERPSNTTILPEPTAPPTEEPIPTPTPTPSPPPSSDGGSGANVFGGSNLYYIAGTNSDQRKYLFGAMQDANMKVLRVWLDAQKNGYTKGTPIRDIPDLETSIGRWDDTVLNWMDEVMVDAHAYGIKLLISMHSNNALYRPDVYANTFGGPDGFYTRQDAQEAFDNRLRHVMDHVHTTLGKKWSELSEYIFAFEAQNEAMIGLGQEYIKSHQDWQCNRAKTIRSALNGNTGILVTTGGASWVDESIQDGWLNCPELDIIALHAYGQGDFDTGKLQGVVQRAQNAGKMLMMQEWGVCYYQTGQNQNCDSGPADGNRGANVAKWAAQIQAAGMSWLYWQVLPNADPHWGYDFEIGIGEPGWEELKQAAKDARSLPGAFDFSGHIL